MALALNTCQVLQALLPEVQGMAAICCDAVAEGLRAMGLPRWTVSGTKQGLRAADRSLQLLVRSSAW